VESGEGRRVLAEERSKTEGDGEVVTAEGYQGQVVAGESSPLLVYNKADYEKALSEGKLILLYFYANWCPICRAETRDSLYPAFNELDSDQVVGFQVNFKDSETDRDEQELAAKLAIPYQHHKVIIKDGKTVVSSPQEWNKQRYLSEINSRL